MLITCPNCQSSYNVADNALGEKGRPVRCAKCKEVWHAAPSPPAMAEPAVEEWQPSVDEWKPSTDEWQPSVDPPAGNASAQPDDAAWPERETASAVDTPQIEDAPPVAPDQPGEVVEESTGVQPESSDPVEIRRRKVVRQKPKKERGPIMTAGFVAAVLAAMIVALVFARGTVVRSFPQTASLYRHLGFNINVRGVDFADLKTSYETQDGTRVLIVEGEIRNISNAVQPVANIRYALRNASGIEVYGWTGLPDRNLIPPGEATPFRTRLASPPNDGRDVRVSFVPREANAPQKQ